MFRLIQSQHFSNYVQRFDDLKSLFVLQRVLDEKIQFSDVPALDIGLRIDEMTRHQSDVVESVFMKDLLI